MIQLVLVDLKVALGNFPSGVMHLRLLVMYRPILSILSQHIATRRLVYNGGTFKVRINNSVLPNFVMKVDHKI